MMVNLNTSWSIAYFDFCIKILQQQPLEYYVSRYVSRYGMVVLSFDFCIKIARGWSLAVAATSVNLRWPVTNSPVENLFNRFHSPD